MALLDPTLKARGAARALPAKEQKENQVMDIRRLKSAVLQLCRLKDHHLKMVVSGGPPRSTSVLRAMLGP